MSRSNSWRTPSRLTTTRRGASMRSLVVKRAAQATHSRRRRMLDSSRSRESMTRVSRSPQRGQRMGSVSSATMPVTCQGGYHRPAAAGAPGPGADLGPSRSATSAPQARAALLGDDEDRFPAVVDRLAGVDEIEVAALDRRLALAPGDARGVDEQLAAVGRPVRGPAGRARCRRPAPPPWWPTGRSAPGPTPRPRCVPRAAWQLARLGAASSGAMRLRRTSSTTTRTSATERLGPAGDLGGGEADAVSRRARPPATTTRQSSHSVSAPMAKKISERQDDLRVGHDTSSLREAPLL